MNFKEKRENLQTEETCQLIAVYGSYFNLTQVGKNHNKKVMRK